MVSTAGVKATLLPPSAISTLITDLLPQTTILTPNIPEARLIQLCSKPSTNHLEDLPEEEESYGINSVDDLEHLAQQLHSLGPEWILVKGGHLPFTKARKIAKSEKERELVIDILVGPNNQLYQMECDYVPSRSTHGTGCSLACKFSSCRIVRGKVLMITQ